MDKFKAGDKVKIIHGGSTGLVIGSLPGGLEPCYVVQIDNEYDTREDYLEHELEKEKRE